jgi:integrase
VFYGFLVDEEILLSNPFAGARRTKRTLKSRAAPAPRFSLNECLALIAALERPIDRAYVFLGLGQGWRAQQEPLRLLVKDIGEDEITVRGKSRTETRPLLPEVEASLRPLCEGKRPDEPLIGYRGSWLAKRFKLLCVAAGVAPRPPKAPRTTASSLWSASAGSGVALDRFMRHVTPVVAESTARSTSTSFGTYSNGTIRCAKFCMATTLRRLLTALERVVLELLASGVEATTLGDLVANFLFRDIDL